MKRLAFLALLAVGLFGSTLAQGLTADQILDRVEEKSFIGTETGGMTATVKLSITEQGETLDYVFKVFFQKGEGNEPDKALMVYLQPDLVSGTMFLTWKPQEGDARMWLYLPDLGLVKELVGEAREQEFVSGSGVSYEDLAQGFRFRDDYVAELVGEEQVGDRVAYVIALTPKSGASPEYTQIKLWVEQENFNVVRMESYSDDQLVKTMMASDLYDDGLGYIPHRFEFQNLSSGTSSTMSLVDRAVADLPSDYFDPEKLPTLEIEGL